MTKLGSKVKIVCSVWADPEISGLFTLKTENMVRMPTGSIGIIEDIDIVKVQFFTIRFPGNLRARVAPWLFESII